MTQIPKRATIIKPAKVTNHVKTVSEIISAFVSNLEFHSIPCEVLGRLKNIVLDTLGTTVGGSKVRALRPIVEVIRSFAALEESTIIGHSCKSSSPYAGYVNSVAAAYLELDNGYHLGTVHPACIIVPTAFAVAEPLGLGGKDVLTAVLAGHEVMLRTGRATRTQVNRGTDPSGSCGCFGAVATAGKLLGLNQWQMANAFGIAGLQTPLSPLEWMHKPSTAKSLHMGQASYVGIISALLAQKGATGPLTIFEGDMGFCQATVGRKNRHKLTRGLGRMWETKYTYYKFHSSCRWTHSSIDCVLELRKKHKLVASDVKKIHVTTFPQAAKLTETVPRDETMARFSLPYTMAVALVDGKVGPEQFSRHKLRDAEILALARKVTIATSPGFSVYPTKRPATVVIERKDGTRLRHHEDYCFGDCPQRMPSNKDIESKFYEITKRIMNRTEAQKVKMIVDKLDTAKNLDEVFRLIR